MSKGKILDLKYSKIVKIVQSINKNTIANRNRTKEDKIKTDKFLKQEFNINRKDFSETVKKKTNIRYNKSTFLYDIDIKHKDTIKELQNTSKQVKSIPHISKPVDNTKELQELIPLINDIKELVKYYKTQKEHIEVVDNEITLDMDKLSGEITSRSFRIYKNILDDFLDYCKHHKEYKKQDIMSMALVEYMKKNK